jgi:hypothetical protein
MALGRQHVLVTIDKVINSAILGRDVPVTLI